MESCPSPLPKTARAATHWRARRTACLAAGAAVCSWVALCGLALSGLAAAPSHAADSRRLDPSEARAERERGSIVPLEQILKAVSQQLPGRQVGVELEDDDGQKVYEIKWLLPDGRRLEIEIEARDGRWLQMKGSRLETAFRRAATGSMAP